MPLSSRMSLTPQKLWLGASKQGHVSGTSVYREKEDMYDEIIELKKSLHMQKCDVDLMRTKLRRLEEENNRKDRQIEQLLDPGRGPDFVRTLAEKKPDAGWVVTGLRQRIFRLEQQCKEKDSTISKLQTDMKTTNLEEMRITMETYYKEIHRLQTLLASSEATGKKPTMEKKLGMKRQKMSSTLLNLTQSMQELTEENQSLEDLDRMLSNSPGGSKIKGYVDWSKPRLLRRIAELEKKISSLEKPSTSELIRSNPLIHSSSNISTPKQPKGDQPRVDSPKGDQSRVETPKGDQPKVDSPKGNQPKVDQSEDQERLRGTVKNLKVERNALRAQLLEKDVEVKQLLQAKVDLEKELEMAREAEKERQEREQALKEEIETLTSKCQELEEAKKQERDALVAAAQEAHQALHIPSACSKHSQPDDSEPDSHNSGSRPSTPCSEEKREAAAKTLQAQWRAYRGKKREAALDEAATALQAAFRGHLARSKLLQSKARDSSSFPSLPSLPTQHSPTLRGPSPIAQADDSPAQEEAITVIQSVLRGHLARARFIASCKGTATMAPQRGAAVATHPESTSLPGLEASSGAIRVGPFAKEEPRETAMVDTVPSSHPSAPHSAQGGEWSCLSPSSLKAVPCSSVKGVMCVDACEERSSSAGSSRPPSLEPCSAGLQLVSPLPVEDFNSDDSDDIIISPFLPRKKKSPSPF